MAWWAGTCALIGLGAWAIVRIVDRRTTFGSTREWELPPVEVPGFKPPGEDDSKWSSPRAALRLTLSGAVGGALTGWWISMEPADLDPRLAVLAQLFAVAAAAFVLIRVLSDPPTVGEAPPDDPDEMPAARRRKALTSLAFAGFGLLLAWLVFL